MLTRLLVLFALSAASLLAADVAIVRVFSGWRGAGSFKRVSEYFDGQENTGGELMRRTHADQRGGYYFLVRLRNSAGAQPVRLSLQVITSAAAKPATYAFPADLPAGDTVINLGLTGPDWPDQKANPIAWKLEVLAADGRVLATEKSYLWEKPAGS